MKLNFCCACGSINGLEVHHLVPKSSGGTDDEKNLLTICFECHGKVHGMVRKDIRTLTIAGLSKAKKRGVKFGSPNPEKGSKVGVESIQKIVNEYAHTLAPLVSNIFLENSRISLRDICEIFRDKKIKTSRGGESWNPSQIKNILDRLGWNKGRNGWIKIEIKSQ